ncbi:hypothetical protein GCM10020000_27360 [Streptomyces olivoverticillatus]
MGPVDTATGCFLGLLDGARGLPLLREEAQALGLPEGRADGVVERLTAAGLIDDARAGGARERSPCATGAAPGWSGCGRTWPRSPCCTASPVRRCG